MKLSDVKLDDPAVFQRGVPHEAFRLLRREAPVHFHEEEGGPGFWVISRYHDLKYVSKNPEIFSSHVQGTMLRDPEPDDLPSIQAIMINMDPPRHRQYRALVNKAFTPRMMQRLETRVEKMVDGIIDGVVEKGECDFVEEIAALLPMQVICEMMGVPEEDRRRIYELGNQIVFADDPEMQEEPAADQQSYTEASAEMFLDAGRLAEKARKHTGDDLATALLQAEVDGERISELDFNSFFLLLSIAGNETTRTVTTNGMLTLIEHPDQREQLRSDPSLIPSGVEEILRFAPAVHHFRRTATRDVEIRGRRIRRNDKVTLWYPSANRDEEVFENPERFDVRRSPNEHLAFGVGEHFCLGANLARMELRQIFKGLVLRLPDLDLAAEPRRVRSNFINGVKEMRVRFSPGKPRSA